MGTEDPVGRTFGFMAINGRIVGVLKNFHFKGADQPIEPIAFALAEPRYLEFILIRLSGSDIPQALKTAENTWNKIIPEYPFDYSFVSEQYNDLFRSQIRLANLLKYFTILAVIIACLGLYGLSAYSAQKRTNEIGIRKVMGADTKTILYSMIREFVLLISISLLIAVPAGWLIVKSLLNQFASHIDIKAEIFVLISAGTIIIAILTVLWQAFKASRINPAVALKIE
jgi:ABC-type antimicrobial peptide transport system permease subunit